MITGSLDQQQFQISLFNFVLNLKQLVWAGFVPPLEIVNLSLKKGEMRWDYHQRFVWCDQIVSASEYEAAKGQLIERGYRVVPFEGRPCEIWAWEATQHEHNGGVPYELAAHHCKKLLELEREIEVAMAQGDDEQATALNFLLSDAYEAAAADGVG